MHSQDWNFFLFIFYKCFFYVTFRNADTETGVQKITIVDKFMHPNYDTPDRHVAFTSLSSFQKYSTDF
jgi:hypothetical protein